MQAHPGPQRIGRFSRDALAKKRPIACHRCHAQKVKCSGEKPCSRCRQGGYEGDCTYVVRDRKVRVDERYPSGHPYWHDFLTKTKLIQNASYLEQLIKDSNDLQSLRRQSESNSISTTSRPKQRGDFSPTEPTVHETSWFQSPGELPLPLFVSEVTCTAFATRLCKWLSGDEGATPHLPRMVCNDPEDDIRRHTDTPWPSLARARLLVSTALGHAGPAFHLGLPKATLDYLDTIYKNALFEDSITLIKYFALFALGEVCSISTASQHGDIVPGTPYYARALSVLHLLPDRPSMAHIEAMATLSLYSQFQNRWHTAYSLVGTALRLALSVGLHQNIPHEHCSDMIEREHRVRLWWTVYMFDRFWSLKLGLPLQVSEDDIQVDMPSDCDIDAFSEEFVCSVEQVAYIKLARISGSIMRQIYARTVSAESFLQRLEMVMKNLNEYITCLPEHLRPHKGKPRSKNTIRLHLQFYYCVIITVRPILLGILDRGGGTHSNPPATLPPSLAALSEQCISSARETVAICADEWTKGSLPIYGYAFAQCIFTSSIILVLSSLLPIGRPDDINQVETAAEMLASFVANGNPVADHLNWHLQRVLSCVRSGKFASASISLRTAVQHPDCWTSPTLHPDTQGYRTTSPPQITADGPPFQQSVEAPELYHPISPDILRTFAAESDIFDSLDILSANPAEWPPMPLWSNDGF
ncbi:fungal-specific transcription factor domain-containing protein [Aspergillus karnatakaensis]|uniref:Zn(II)2Cys6 transcription factor n=1 Tax=Aspergillus karnatakaensis TaxID=1810916 RepID=UPI003CCC9031